MNSFFKTKKIIFIFYLTFQVIVLILSPLFSLAADPVVGGRIQLLRPSDLKEAYSASMKKQGVEVKVTFDNLTARTGDKIVAQALPQGFKEDSDELYYTWYLKREGCELGSSGGSCDRDNDGKITVNDWKIEAAKIIAKGDFDKENDTDYNSSSDSNSDGYEVSPDPGDWEMPYKSQNDVDIEDCYIQDFEKGRFYELRKTIPVYSCESGGSVACGKNELITCESGTRNICAETDDYECKVESDEDVENFQARVKCPQISGLASTQQKNPVCGQSNRTIFEYIVNDSANKEFICNILKEDLSAGGMCSVISTGSPTCTFKKSNNLCKHLFPTQVAPKDLRGSNIKTGDGDFEMAEEKFWGTDPNNKSTAENGIPDEANVLGLGAKSFSWTYRSGDQVGLAVEGISAVATKHDDNAYMRTWAFSNNVCKKFSDEIKKKRAFYVEYQKVPQIDTGFLTVDFDLNDCLEENLLDPTGGGVGNLEVNVLANPSRANNDSTRTGTGDNIKAQTTVSGTDDVSSLYYEWTVEASNDGTKAPLDDKWIDVTNKLEKHSTMKGFGINEFEFKAEFPDDIFYGSNRLVQYIRIKAKVSENSSEQNRIGRGSAIVQLTKSSTDIDAYLVKADDDGKISLKKDSEICTEGEELAECPIIENSIIGLAIPNKDGQLVNFSWKINKENVFCNSEHSSECKETGSNIIFFPAVGTDGEIFEAEVTFKDTKTKMAQTVNRKFKIVQPSVNIESANKDLVWPKQLGIYKDMEGNETADNSSILFETIQGNSVFMKAAFTPSWISSYATYFWEVDGDQYANSENLEFLAENGEGSTYDVSIEAVYAMATDEEQVLNVRKALYNIWGVSAQDATERYLDSSAEVEVVQSYDELAKAKGGLMASLVSNLPGEMMFLLRLALTAVLMIVVMGAIFYVTPGLGKNKTV